MRSLSYIVLVLHFIGLAMGMSVSIANGVMLGLMRRAAPAERSVLARFLPLMSRVGRAGLMLLWATGLIMVYTRWNGFAGMPWTFHAKLAAVLVLTAAVLYIRQLEALVRSGNQAAALRMPLAGTVASAGALLALIFAVLTFD